MGVRPRAVALVVAGDEIVIIRRRAGGERFSVLPGGGVEDGETPEEAAIRELHEETGLCGVLEQSLGAYASPDRVAHYFLIRATRRELRLGGPERERLVEEPNRYEPAWVRVEDLPAEALQPVELRGLVPRWHAAFHRA